MHTFWVNEGEEAKRESRAALLPEEEQSLLQWAKGVSSISLVEEDRDEAHPADREKSEQARRPSVQVAKETTQNTSIANPGETELSTELRLLEEKLGKRISKGIPPSEQV